MTVLSPLRRIGLSVIALTASAALVSGCGNSTSGKPLGLGTGANSVGVSTAGSSGAVAPGGSSDVPGPTPSDPTPSDPTASDPVASGSLSPGGSTGGANAAFCAKLQNLGTPDLSGGGSGIDALAAQFQSLADSAPADIKPDLQLVADFLKGAASGTPDTSKIQEYTDALKRIGTYVTTACI